MIRFVNNYQDLSTDKGYQFKFHCDKCGNGFMSKFQPSYIGMAGSFLNAASNLLGWGHSAGNSAYEVQRAVGGSPHAVKPSEEQKLPKLCACGFDVGSAKFCPECGAPAQAAKPKCTGCGHEVEVTTKFCPECGTNIR